MGELTDVMRATLHELAQSDARVLRELEASSQAAQASLDDGLEKLSLKQLRDLGKQRGFKSLTKYKKDELIGLLRGGEPPIAALPARSASAASAAPAASSGAGAPADLAARLERMEALLQKIASHLGVA